MSERQEGGASYTYWVREAREDAAPLPVPRKLTSDDDLLNSQPPTLGSVWNRVPLLPSFLSDTAFASIPFFNFLPFLMCIYLLTLQAGTWEEKNLNKWASDRIKVAFLHSTQTQNFTLLKTLTMLSARCVRSAYAILLD